MTRAGDSDVVVEFTTGDGQTLNLIHVLRPSVAPRRGPVLLVHGAGVRANIFRAPSTRRWSTSCSTTASTSGSKTGGRASTSAPTSGPSTRRPCATTPPPCARSWTTRAQTIAEGGHPLPGLDQLHDGCSGRAPARGLHHRLQRGVAPPGRADDRPLENRMLPPARCRP